MKTRSCVMLVAVLVVGCSKKNTDPATATDPVSAVENGSSAPTIPSTGTDNATESNTKEASEPAPPPSELAAPTALPCETVANHLVESFPNDYQSPEEQKATALATCEREWAAPMRECMQQTRTKHEPLSCATRVREAECKLSFERLGALAKLDGRSDASLPTKEKALAAACSDLGAESRKCLVEATTLAAYRQCQEIQPVAEIAASSELGWALEGLETWAWPAYYKGRAAERVTTQPIEVGSEFVRPSLRIRCNENRFEVSVWSKLLLDDGGKAKTKLATTMKLDEGEEFTTPATVEMSEHIAISAPEEFAKALRGHTSLEFRFTVPKGVATTFHFGINGIDAALDRLGNCADS